VKIYSFDLLLALPTRSELTSLIPLFPPFRAVSTADKLEATILVSIQCRIYRWLVNFAVSAGHYQWFHKSWSLRRMRRFNLISLKRDSLLFNTVTVANCVPWKNNLFFTMFVTNPNMNIMFHIAVFAQNIEAHYSTQVNVISAVWGVICTWHIPLAVSLNKTRLKKPRSIIEALGFPVWITVCINREWVGSRICERGRGGRFAEYEHCDVEGQDGFSKSWVHLVIYENEKPSRVKAKMTILTSYWFNDELVGELERFVNGVLEVLGYHTKVFILLSSYPWHIAIHRTSILWAELRRDEIYNLPSRLKVIGVTCCEQWIEHVASKYGVRRLTGH